MLAPPDDMPAEIKAIWAEVIDRLPEGKRIDGHRLEVYCQQLHAFRRAAADISENGVRIDDATGRTVRNPSIDTLRDMTKQMNTWGAEFAPPTTAPKRRRGTLYDATTRSIKAAEHLQGKKQYDGAIEAVRTLAWLIDEAQRDGLHAIRAAAFGMIPSYLKGCAALQITPESTPVLEEAKKRPGRGRAGGPQRLKVV